MLQSQQLYVKVEYPLKQGLKPQEALHFPTILHKVKVEYPLKQGLKLLKIFS